MTRTDDTGMQIGRLPSSPIATMYERGYRWHRHTDTGVVCLWKPSDGQAPCGSDVAQRGIESRPPWDPMS